MGVWWRNSLPTKPASYAAGSSGGGYLDESCASVEVEVQILDVAEVTELVVDVVLLCLLVQSRDEDEPPLHS